MEGGFSFRFNGSNVFHLDTVLQRVAFFIGYGLIHACVSMLIEQSKSNWVAEKIGDGTIITS